MGFGSGSFSERGSFATGHHALPNRLMSNTCDSAALLFPRMLPATPRKFISQAQSHTASKSKFRALMEERGLGQVLWLDGPLKTPDTSGHPRIWGV